MTLNVFVGAAIHDGLNLHLDQALLVHDGVAVGIRASPDFPEGSVLHQLDGGFLTPGFVDLQVNGGGGVMFNDEQSMDSLHAIAQAHASTGTQAFLPTLITDSPERSSAAIKAVATAIEKGLPGIVGIHLEGPHLSIRRKGAHDPSLIRPMSEADLELISDAARRLPNVMLTIAPENVTRAQVAALSKAGVIVSLGHTDADYDTSMEFFAAGARCATHLFNAMSQFGSRNPGLVGATLDNGTVSSGLIADGVHVHPAAIRTALRAKNGPGRIYLVTDAMSSVGSDLTEFQLNGRTVFRRDGTLRLSDGTLAGADIDMPHSIGVLVNEVGIDTELAIAMATSIPASILRSGSRSGKLGSILQSSPIYLTKDFQLKTLEISGCH